ncbi:MAG: hypothetical protein QOE84_3049 [Actinomycetota bacterium]|jgi:peptidoglycan/xylan/chitin deacetylase (PgdA/CDA1 family)|nr:hypothetical protein [Actinomycetota bacterium]
MTGGIVSRAAGAARAAGLAATGSGRFRGGVVFAYHDIGNDPANTTDYYVSSALMRRQLQDALRWGLRFIDLADFSERAIAGSSLDGLAAVVFDDSLVGVHHHAMPVLLELGVPATVFTVSAALGRDPAWWPGAARVMTRAEAEEMAAAGFRLASHTRSHASLPHIPPAQLTDELVGARAELEDITGAAVDVFAYPFGHYDERVVDEVRAAGYRCAYTFLNGRVTEGLDLFRLPRLNMWDQGRLRLAYHLARSASSWPNHQLPEFYGNKGIPESVVDGA